MIELTAEQKQKVSEWIKKGDSLSDVQKKLATEFQITMTYMDVRFLVDDLGVALKDKEAPRKPAPAVPVAADAGLAAEDEDVEELAADGAGFEPPGAAGIGKAIVEVDRITKPGSLVSGTVVFGDGVKASWMLDAQGRLALAASKPGYRPSAEDIRAFQTELGKELQKRGF